MQKVNRKTGLASAKLPPGQQILEKYFVPPRSRIHPVLPSIMKREQASKLTGGAEHSRVAQVFKLAQALGLPELAKNYRKGISGLGRHSCPSWYSWHLAQKILWSRQFRLAAKRNLAQTAGHELTGKRWCMIQQVIAVLSLTMPDDKTIIG